MGNLSPDPGHVRPLDPTVDIVRERCPGSRRSTDAAACRVCGEHVGAPNAPEHLRTIQRHADPRHRAWVLVLSNLPPSTFPATRAALDRVGLEAVAERLNQYGFAPQSVDWSLPLPCLRLTPILGPGGQRFWLWSR